MKMIDVEMKTARKEWEKHEVEEVWSIIISIQEQNSSII